MLQNKTFSRRYPSKAVNILQVIFLRIPPINFSANLARVYNAARLFTSQIIVNNYGQIVYCTKGCKDKK